MGVKYSLVPPKKVRTRQVIVRIKETKSSLPSFQASHLDWRINDIRVGIPQVDVNERRTLEELVKLVAQRTGISEAQAKGAIETVLGFLKDKLPAPIAGQIDGLLSGGAAPDLGNLAQGLGGLLGRK